MQSVAAHNQLHVLFWGASLTPHPPAGVRGSGGGARRRHWGRVPGAALRRGESCCAWGGGVRGLRGSCNYQLKLNKGGGAGEGRGGTRHCRDMACARCGVLSVCGRVSMAPSTSPLSALLRPSAG